MFRMQTKARSLRLGPGFRPLFIAGLAFISLAPGGLQSGFFAELNVAFAGQVRLKNGLVIQGQPTKLISMATLQPANTGPTTIYNIVAIQTGWQRYFVPLRQIPGDALDLNAALIRGEEFTVPQLKSSRSQSLQTLGSIVEATPFDEFGRRRVTLASDRGPLEIVQGITKLTPEYAAVSAAKWNWDFGIATQQLSQETVLRMLANPVICRPNDEHDRMAKARFLIQAGWYPQADAELTGIAADFPSLQTQVETVRQELKQLFAREVLRELGRRRNAGQFQLAREAIRKIPATLGAGLQRDLQRFLAEEQQADEAVERIAALLGDAQSKLTDPQLVAAVGARRSQLLKELDRHGLPQLQPLLQTENDPQYEPAERLALAFSGWVLGGAQAEIDLPKALRLWDARGLIADYLRASDADRRVIAQELRQIESLGPEAVAAILRQLPPVLEAEGIVPGELATVVIPPSGGVTASIITGSNDSVTPVANSPQDGKAVSYRVILPSEYSPAARYPLIIALRSEDMSSRQAALWWSGSREQPGWAQRRGMIVIAPDYLPEATRSYSYGAAAHAAVQTALRDARLRFAVDSDRVYLVGHGMGADAAFDIALSHPHEFAGVIPIGGVADHSAPFLTDNASLLSWYIVRGELSRDATSKGGLHAWLDRLFRRGAEHNLIYVQYSGRGGSDLFADELPRLFDWLELSQHRRGPWPKDWHVRVVRSTDHETPWLTALELPRNYLFPPPQGEATTVRPMELETRITDGNTVYVQSPARRQLVRLSTAVVDPEKRIAIRVNGRQRFHDFIKPDVDTMLDDYARHGDRQRIAQVILEF